jgi:hypothetical protein
MKRVFAILTAVLICHTARPQSPWFMGVSVNPSLTIPHMSISLPSPKARFNYSIGVNCLYSVSQSFFVRSGINYTRKSLLWAKDIIDTRFSYDPLTGKIDPSRIGKADISEAFDSVVLPLILNYKVASNEQSSLMIFSGVEPAYVFQRRQITDSSVGGETVAKTNRHELAGSLTAGIGLYQPLWANIVLLLVPKYSYDFYPSLAAENLAFHTISLDVELYFHIN